MGARALSGFPKLFHATFRPERTISRIRYDRVRDAPVSEFAVPPPLTDTQPRKPPQLRCPAAAHIHGPRSMAPDSYEPSETFRTRLRDHRTLIAHRLRQEYKLRQDSDLIDDIQLVLYCTLAATSAKLHPELCWQRGLIARRDVFELCDLWMGEDPVGFSRAFRKRLDQRTISKIRSARVRPLLLPSLLRLADELGDAHDDRTQTTTPAVVIAVEPDQRTNAMLGELEDALSQLPRVQREIVIGRFIHDESVESLCARLAVPVHRFHGLRKEALEFLRRELNPPGPDLS